MNRDEPVTRLTDAEQEVLGSWSARTKPSQRLEAIRLIQREAQAAALAPRDEGLLEAVEAWQKWRWNECSDPLRVADYELADRAAKARALATGESSPGERT